MLPPDVAVMFSGCSTPFGITEYIGRVKDDLPGLTYECSTPFGITEYIGWLLGVVAAFVPMCSTPFGITEYIGRASQVVPVQERRHEFAWT